MEIKRASIERIEIDNISQLEIGDEIEIRDIEDLRATFIVAHKDNLYVYLMRKYLLHEVFDKPFEDVLVWLNKEYRISLEGNPGHIYKVTIPYVTNVQNMEVEASISQPQWDIFKKTDRLKFYLEDGNRKINDWWVLDNLSPAVHQFYYDTEGNLRDEESYDYPLDRAGILPCLMISIT